MERIGWFFLFIFIVGCVPGRQLPDDRLVGITAAREFTELAIGNTAVWGDYQVKYAEGGEVISSETGTRQSWYLDSQSILCQTTQSTEDLCWAEITRRLDTLDDNKYRVTTRLFVDEFCILENGHNCGRELVLLRGSAE